MASADFLRSQNGDAEDWSTELDAGLDDALGLLSDRTRRAALYVVSETESDAMFVVDLAQKVALFEDTSDDIETVLTELTHAHLPQMAAAGIVEYDDESNMVRYAGDERIESLLDQTKAVERSD
jgi:hypothetical protein